ncbi:aminoglycoside phosphotransferase family protein [Paenibacillus frigoriresistens]|uniref:aminoglycoside phosphotransferase family protein n=1 Tax=Paenibacillus alginolyticus TaxID=59839 RepID=UPI00156504F5|nr:aminoglycoside phosphotransferase family protein [Paenibacillus frigoriresistens]NRF93933.1 aminoglycoside phosphotransferase family protein [Paenibacillus frigoriresistens]
MGHPITDINWMVKSKVIDSLLEQGSSLTIIPLDSGLEAEVTKICTAETSFVLKVWNRDSKPDVERQYWLLDSLNNRGLSVSKPFGWGLDKYKNQVLLTSFDGSPLNKVNQSKLTKLANMLTTIHRFPLEDLDSSILQKHDFVSYFYPKIEEHQDIQNLLIRLTESANLKQDCLIHGDFNLGNILEAEGKFTMIDWTNGQLGDPRYDIAWSIVLIKIYVGERYGSVYRSAYKSQNQYTNEELELFEAIACLRWLLLNRIVGLPKSSNTITRVKNILKSNLHLNGNLL